MLVGYEEKVLEIGTDSTYYLLVKDNQPRAGIIKTPRVDIKPNWLPYIAVSDVMTVSERVEMLGGTLLVEPDQNIREGRTAIIADPSGAVFAIQQFEAFLPE
jgi:predicted enzyme related to lactoylglutathione lyase